MRTLMLCLLSIAMVACGDARAANEEEASWEAEAPIPVATATATTEERPRVLELTGTLEANRRARLSPQVSGHVAEVLVERGTAVEEGDPLVVLRPGDFRLGASAASARADAALRSLGLSELPADEAALDETPAVVAARADWEAASDRLERTRTLFEAGAVAAQTWEEVQAAAESARARYESSQQQARSTLSNYRALRAEAALRRKDAADATLRAPFAGAVTSRSVEVGEFVGPQSPIVELVDASRLRLELDVPERFANRVHEGQHLQVWVDGTDQILDATVRFVSAALDTERRTLTVEAVVPNEDGAVRAGHFGRARLELGERRELVRVPRAALTSRAGVERVYVIEDGVAVARIVEVAEHQGEDAFVEGELAAGDVVVLDPGREVADGTLVEERGGPARADGARAEASETEG